MIELSFEADVQCAADNVFDLIADLRGQDRWLTGSMSFHGTTEVSTNAVALGTTYREFEPLGVRNGTVTEFEPPTKITFHQPMTLRLRAGVIDVTVRYMLTPVGKNTHVRRVVTLGMPLPMKLVQPIVVRAFRAESRRTLVALKAYADRLQ
jgi:hypothetical protein